MPFVLGIVAALAGPLTMTLGFILWDNCWTGSPFALNMFKCSLASIGFVIASAASRLLSDEQPFSSDIFQRENVGYLMLSSVIGIIIGDWTWLEGLRLLGARRVIVMDSLKPFLAAVFGWAFLDEQLRLAALGGIVLTVVGIILVSLESETTIDPEDEECEEQGKNELADQIQGDLIPAMENTSSPVKSKAVNPEMSTTTIWTEGTSTFMGGESTPATAAKPGTLSLGTGSFMKDEVAQPVMMDEMIKPSIEKEDEEGFEIEATNDELKSESAEINASHLVETTTNADIANSQHSSISTAPTKTTTNSTTTPPDNTNANKRARTVRETQWGFAMAIINVFLDTYGSVLTKNYGTQFTTWEINLIRFGFAGAMMMFCSVLLQLRDYLISANHNISSGKGNTNTDKGHDAEMGQSNQEPTPIEDSATATINTANNQQDNPSALAEDVWYKLPRDTMSQSAWMHVVGGVLFVTFITPALSNYALFQIALALALTLGSVGPLYALPLTYLFQKHQQRPSLRACLGAALAVAGIVVLAFWGTLD